MDFVTTSENTTNTTNTTNIDAGIEKMTLEKEGNGEDSNDDEDDDITNSNTTDTTGKKKKKKKKKSKSKKTSEIQVPIVPPESRLLGGSTQYFLKYGQTNPPTIPVRIIIFLLHYCFFWYLSLFIIHYLIFIMYCRLLICL